MYLHGHIDALTDVVHYVEHRPHVVPAV